MRIIMRWSYLKAYFIEHVHEHTMAFIPIHLNTNIFIVRPTIETAMFAPSAAMPAWQRVAGSSPDPDDLCCMSPPISLPISCQPTVSILLQIKACHFKLFELHYQMASFGQRGTREEVCLSIITSPHLPHSFSPPSLEYGPPLATIHHGEAET